LPDQRIHSAVYEGEECVTSTPLHDSAQ
jgi:hypothetical protein